MIDPNAVTPGRVKFLVKGTKFYLPVIFLARTRRPLHRLCRTATEAQAYSERFLAKWKTLKP